MPDSATNFYHLLGVSKNATEAQMRAAYRSKARELHPDRNPGNADAEERFKAVNQAYETLKDPKKRRTYDHMAARQDPVDFRSRNARDDDFDLGSLFGQGGAFGGSFGRSASRRGMRGVDIDAQITLSFEEAFHGVEVRVPVERDIACSLCHGRGAALGAHVRKCPTCSGHGMVNHSQGPFAMSELCPDCHGSGTFIEQPCPDCQGRGIEGKLVRYRVKIPGGIKDRSTVKVGGKGAAGKGGGSPGDLLVHVHVQASELFERRGDDFIVEVPVTLAEAALGVQAKVPLVEGGQVTVRMSAGAADGKLLRIAGRGAPRPQARGGGRGDLLARVRISVPTTLSPDQEEALRAYQRATGDGVRTQWFRKRT